MGCEHDNAMQDEQFPGIYFCPDEGIFVDEAGKEVPDPTAAPAEKPKRSRSGGGSQSGKADAPASGGKRAYHRDPNLMVTAKCNHPGCPRTWQVWPQNLKDEMLCPELHLPLLKQQQARDRQRRHRQKIRQQNQ